MFNSAPSGRRHARDGGGKQALSSFRKLNDFELDRLSDEDLIDYIRRARSVGERQAMNLAIQIFAYRQRKNLLNRVRAKLGSRPDSDIEQVTDLIVGGAMFAAFEGESVGEFKSLVNRIMQRRVADYYRRIHGQVGYTPLAEEVEGEERVHGATLEADEEISLIWAADLVETALGELSAPHRAVVDYRLLQGYGSKETAELVNNHLSDDLDRPMTVSNVDKIVSRFRERLDDLLEEANREPPDPDNDDG